MWEWILPKSSVIFFPVLLATLRKWPGPAIEGPECPFRPLQSPLSMRFPSQLGTTEISDDALPGPPLASVLAKVQEEAERWGIDVSEQRYPK